MDKKNYLAIFAKSFNWAGFFLPKKVYEDCAKLYAFCRILDDVADEKTNLDSRIEKFNKIKNFFKKSYDLKNNEELELNENEKIINEVINLAANNNIKIIIFEDLIDGVGSDLKKKIHIRSVKDLLVYSYRVAGSVGLVMSKILNVNDRRALKGAIDLGIAMQLTNIARDVIEDKKMNREYIKPDFENIQATLKLAEMFYDSSFSSIQKIPFKYKFSIIVARRIYRQIGRKILQKGNMENYEKSGKIYVNNFEKIYQTIISIFDLILVYLKEIEPHQRAKEHNIISQEVDLDERI
ncbi:squalene/phytoene synthase family protein [Candidatus Pelagibacter sp. HIMB1483]|uniref:squalene/phytoene synthase family protein n=1 Tax=Candidatus Pelagibacter sp. HIMB1483 TaxID=3415414 RepID=UPI003F824A0E